MHTQVLRINQIPNMNSFANYKKVMYSKDMRYAVGWEIKAQKIQPIQSYPIDVEIRSYFARRRFDPTNVSFWWKFCEDRLVELGILKDDSPIYVRDVLIRQPAKSTLPYSYMECALIEDAPTFALSALP